MKIVDHKHHGEIIDSQLFENEQFTHLLQYKQTNEYTHCLQLIQFQMTNIINIVPDHEYSQIISSFDCTECHNVVIMYELMEIKQITIILHCIQFNNHEPNYKKVVKRSNQHSLKLEIEQIERQILALKSIETQSATDKLSALNELLQHERSHFLRQQRWTRNSRKYRERKDAKLDHLNKHIN